MKIIFLDPIVWDYNIETPLNQPMVGSQSALCYLAAELARLGHDVSLINNTSSTSNIRGVRCIRWAEGANTKSLNGADVVVVLNVCMGARLRAGGVASRSCFGHITRIRSPWSKVLASLMSAPLGRVFHLSANGWPQISFSHSVSLRSGRGCSITELVSHSLTRT